MAKVITWQVKPNFVKQYQAGYPLIRRDTIAQDADTAEEGSIVHLQDEQDSFIAKGYFGMQNKGIGWVLTNKVGEKIDFLFFKQKILAAINKRQGFYHDENTNAFRIFNGEGDGIGGLQIDYYAGFYLINWYSEGIFRFKDHVIRVLDELGGYRGIYEKKRFDTKGSYIEDDDFVKGERGEFPLLVMENGTHYAVYLNDGAMTGIFLDQREVRKAIQDKYAKGKHVLNTFSYTGAFSVAAALGGAEKTTSVDLAKRSKNKTIEQFSVNGIDFEQQDIHVMDVFDYFKYARRKGLSFDMVVLDPPSFARSKKRTFSTAKDYPALIEDALSVTAKDGMLVISTNNASFGMKKLKGFVEKGFRDAGASFHILEQFSLPPDFQASKDYPPSNYLKVLVVKRTR